MLTLYRLSTGQREVLPDLRGLHDTLVPWGPHRDRALLHHGDLCLRPLHDPRWDGEDAKPLMTAALIRCRCSCRIVFPHRLNCASFPFHPERRASQVAQAGGREAPKHVPPGDDRPRHRPSPFLSVRGVQVPGRRLAFPQRGTTCGAQILKNPWNNSKQEEGSGPGALTSAHFLS